MTFTISRLGLFVWISFSNSLNASSRYTVNSFGDRPSHCGTPLFVLKMSPCCLPALTFNVVFVSRSLIRLRSHSGTPLERRILISLSLRTLSKALDISIPTQYLLKPFAKEPTTRYLCASTMSPIDLPLR